MSPLPHESRMCSEQMHTCGGHAGKLLIRSVSRMLPALVVLCVTAILDDVILDDVITGAVGTSEGRLAVEFSDDLSWIFPTLEIFLPSAIPSILIPSLSTVLAPSDAVGSCKKGRRKCSRRLSMA
jgi:hypothetical protein